MRTFRPKSWSEQAREMCDEQIMWIHTGWQTIEDAKKFFSNSYRHPLITNRAAKRFGRLLRKGKI